MAEEKFVKETKTVENEDMKKLLDVRDKIYKMIDEGKLPEIKSMTRKQRKEVDAKKLNYFKYGIDSNQNLITKQEQSVDWVLDNVYPDFDFDDLPNNVCFVFGQMVFAATYGDKVSEKN